MNEEINIIIQSAENGFIVNVESTNKVYVFEYWAGVMEFLIEKDSKFFQGSPIGSALCGAQGLSNAIQEEHSKE